MEIRKLNLEMAWQSSEISGSLVSCRNKVTALMVTSDGEKYPIHVGDHYISNYAHESGWDKPGDSVENVWNQLGRPEILRVEVRETGFDRTSGRDHEDWNRLTWYVSEGRIEYAKLELLEWAAAALVEKHIGFTEFKRIMRENL